MTFEECATEIAAEMLRKSGVKEWTDSDVRAAIAEAAVEIATSIFFESSPDMAVTAVGRQQQATAKVFKSSGGDAAITLTSVGNNAARQSVKLDLGATRAAAYAVWAGFEIAATPTAGNPIEIWWAPSPSASAGTDEVGNIAGTDSAYSGYSSNLAASVPQLVFVGNFVCTAQATATVQKGFVGIFCPPTRYGTLVVYNKSGAALHSSATNMFVQFVPIEDTSEPS
jgi:hypothetical protein